MRQRGVHDGAVFGLKVAGRVGVGQRDAAIAFVLVVDQPAQPLQPRTFAGGDEGLVEGAVLVFPIGGVGAGLGRNRPAGSLTASCTALVVHSKKERVKLHKKGFVAKLCSSF